MRICVDARMARSAGIGVYLQNVLGTLVNEGGADVTLLGNAAELSDYAAMRPSSVRLVEFGAGLYSVSEQLGLMRLSKGYDLFWSPHFNIPVLCRSRRLAVTVHDTFHLRFPDRLPGLAARAYARFMYKRAARSADLLVTVSEFSKSELVRYAGADSERVRVIYNGVRGGFGRSGDEARAAAVRRYGGGEEYVLYVGNVKPHKNLGRLLEAYAKARAGGLGYRLAIVGRDEGFVTGFDARAEAERLGVSGHVHFAGEVPSGELPAVYSGARVLVQPSYYEGFGYPPLEAMACGVPVASSNAASLPEVCKDAAVYFDPYDNKEMADRIIAACTDEELRATLINKGYERVRKFPAADSARRTVDALMEAGGLR